MKKLLSFFIIVYLFSNCTIQEPQKDYPIQSVSSNNVELTDNFWSKRIATNNDVTIPYCFEKCEETSRISNFEVAGGLKKGVFEVFRIMT